MSEDILPQLRQRVQGEEFDYGLLMDVLKSYSKPRDKLSRFLASGAIIRVKKGLYVFGDAWRRSPISLELLANLICGPSYISLEYALSYYGLIPERPYVVTSITTKRAKTFSTPVGHFSYVHLNMQKYAVGVVQEETIARRRFLIASPEKAIVDLLCRQSDLTMRDEMSDYLFENMRIDPDRFKTLDRRRFQLIGEAYQDPRIATLVSFL